MNFLFIYFSLLLLCQSALTKCDINKVSLLLTNLWIEPEDGVVSLPGSSANLTCLVHSTNQVLFEWLRDGIALRHSTLPGPSGISVHSQEKNWPYYSILRFHLLRPSHTGTYTCKALDTRLFDQRSASVNVLVSNSFDQLSRHRHLGKSRKERHSLILLLILLLLFLSGLLVLCVVTVKVTNTAK